jgi:hypothetical protein
MTEKRAYLRNLATSSADAWGASPCPPSLQGETRVETRNTVYQFRDGVCFAVMRQDREWKTNPTALIGMRLVGWLPRDLRGGLRPSWEPGAYAVLWRQRGAKDAASSVALTSSTRAFGSAAEAAAPPPSSHRAPPRSGTLPKCPLPKRPLPPTVFRPTTQSVCRVDVPMPPSSLSRSGDLSSAEGGRRPEGHYGLLAGTGA